jgi:hypothetical protein
MNQVFNFQRFARLVNRNWADNKKRYVLSILAFIGLLSLWYMFLLMVENNPVFRVEFQVGVYFFCLYLGGAIFASQYFRDLGSKSKGINYLMTPASILEKFLCSLLYGIVMLFIVLTLAFYFVDVIIISVSNMINESLGKPLPRSEVANVFVAHKSNKDLPAYLFLAFLAIQSFFLLGSVYFKNYSFIKTAIAFFILFIVFVSIEGYFQRNILRGGFINHVREYRVLSDAPYRLVKLPTWLSGVTFGLLKYALPPIFWCTTYFRLKEKEI